MSSCARAILAPWRSSGAFSPNMNELGRLLVVVGLVIVAAGALLWTGLAKGWFGQLPGDIQISRGNVRFYFPIVTCIVVSVVLTLLLWLFRK